jgi:YD repeat-containing protein
MTRLLFVAVTIPALMAATAAMAGEQTTLRDASGRTIGTATTDSQGTTTFRDADGRTTGTASRSGQTTTFRDAGGRTTGTTSIPTTGTRR